MTISKAEHDKVVALAATVKSEADKLVAYIDTLAAPAVPPIGPPPVPLPAPPSKVTLRLSEAAPYGTTSKHLHRGAEVLWEKPGGDWFDKDSMRHGVAPYAVIASKNEGKPQPWTADVTKLVQESPGELEMLLQSKQPRTVGTRRHATPPAVDVVYSDGTAATLACLRSIGLGLGSAMVPPPTPTVSVGPVQGHLALGFERPSKPVTKATLRLTCTAQFGSAVDVQVFRLAYPRPLSTVRRPGLAARYPFDRGIHADPAVLFHMDVERPLAESFVNEAKFEFWDDSDFFDWTGADRNRLPWRLLNRLILRTDVAFPKLADASTALAGYKPIHAASPQALIIPHAVNQENVFNAALFFQPSLTGDHREPFDPAGRLPQRLFLRWQQRLGDDFLPLDGDVARQGGKWGPSFMHKTDIGGWGGRSTVGGQIGWTNRGNFVQPSDREDPAYRALVLGAYPYNAETWQGNGDHWRGYGERACLLPGAWDEIEIEIAMNTIDWPAGKVPAARDGELRAWINGVLSYERTGILWRGNPPWTPGAGVIADQGILGVWWNSYFGGQYGGAPRAGHHFVRGLIVASEYIGPMATAA